MSNRETQIVDLTRLIREVHNLMQQRMAGALADYDITPQQYAVLSATGRLGSITNGDVCLILSLSKGTASGILKRLTERGYLIRQVTAEDKRQTTYRFSEEGESFYKDLQSIHQNMTDALFSGCTNADLAAWSRQMRRLLVALSPKEEQR